MAKGEQRGNHEVKKPKKEKPKEAVPASPFANQGKGVGSAKPTHRASKHLSTFRG
jgi:hypothetical protein